jgi:hypothetical protein
VPELRSAESYHLAELHDAKPNAGEISALREIQFGKKTMDSA